MSGTPLACVVQRLVEAVGVDLEARGLAGAGCGELADVQRGVCPARHNLSPASHCVGHDCNQDVCKSQQSAFRSYVDARS